ncbi:lipid II flippase MurJ [Pedobacter kyonggii]|uniref:Virulence factor MviN n=1 Tax=Pedobacter kyonggii TaxID=1926871 RepID=A0A4Q9HET7_9SPHI|nr:lipid II flippase MurJ [Pedobacter kyonggii]TBO43314.1 hypothetical protein EYS08_08205 [Pedobacter kyonggii]
MRKQAAFIFTIRVIRLGFAILNLSLSSKYFGVSLERDVWLLALNAIIILDIAIWAPLNDTFRAKFQFIRAENGEVAAMQQTKSLLLLIHLITFLLVVIIMLFPQLMVKLLAPGYDKIEQTSLMFMIRVVAPSFLLNQLTKILISILNTYNSFIIPEIIGLVTQFFTLVVILTLAPSIGIISLAISYYAGLILLLIMLLQQLRKRNLDLFSGVLKAKFATALPFFIFSVPFFLPHFSSQINVIVEKSMATSFSAGAISILDYARKFSDIPLEVLSGVLVSLMVPMLTLKFSSKLMDEFFEEFRKIYQLGFLIVAIIVGMLTGCSNSMVDFLYKKGNITAVSLAEISELSMFYGWAVLSIFLYYIYGLSLLSAGKGKLFATYGTLAQLLMIGMNLYFFKDYNIYIFPFSLASSHFIAAAIMACYFPVKNKQLLLITIKYSLLVLVTALMMYFLNLYLIDFQTPLLDIVSNIVILSLILAAAIFIAKLEEYKVIKTYLKRIIS